MVFHAEKGNFTDFDFSPAVLDGSINIEVLSSLWTEAEKNLCTDIWYWWVQCHVKRKNAYHPRGQRLEERLTTLCNPLSFPYLRAQRLVQFPPFSFVWCDVLNISSHKISRLSLSFHELHQQIADCRDQNLKTEKRRRRCKQVWCYSLRTTCMFSIDTMLQTCCTRSGLSSALHTASNRLKGLSVIQMSIK